jgi:subtilisin-like proprotein convertase family protein
LLEILLVLAVATFSAANGLMKVSGAPAEGGGIGIMAVTTITNPNAITINDNTTATPYPSTINVDITGESPTILDVNVSLRGLSHTFPDDINVLLVGPHGQNAIVMSDVGGNPDVSGITLTLDDEAASSLPDGTQLVTGSFRPTNVGAGDGFPPPAPTPSGTSSLSVFDGTNPAGLWRLFIDDDAFLEAGSMATGWSLRLTTNVAPEARDDKYKVDEDDKLKVSSPGVLGNDRDRDEDSLKAELVKEPRHGTVKLKANGGFTYTPDNGFTGRDSFTYRARDPEGETDKAKVEIKVR